MRVSQYNPEPIDTNDIELPSEILELIEDLAANAHEIWALLRIQEGRPHTSLVPYDELSEAQKNYDRQMVTATLRVLVKFGFSIRRLDAETVEPIDRNAGSTGGWV